MKVSSRRPVRGYDTNSYQPKIDEHGSSGVAARVEIDPRYTRDNIASLKYLSAYADSFNRLVYLPR